MKRKTNALFVNTGVHFGKEFSTALSTIDRFGIQIETATVGPHVDMSAMTCVPDVIIIDGRDTRQLDKMARYAAELRCHDAIEQLPILLYGPIKTFASFDVNGYLDDRSPATILSMRIKQYIRLQALKNEYALRLQTIESFGIPVDNLPLPQKVSKPRLLFTGKASRYFEFARLFNGAAQLKQAASLELIDAQVQDHHYDCLFIDSLTTANFNLVAFRDFKYRTKFFDLPVIIFQEGLDFEAQEDFLHHGGCELFDLHPDAQEVVQHTYSIINDEYSRMHLINAFECQAFQSFVDHHTGLPTRSFFERHLERLTHQSNEWNRPLTFGIIQTHSNINPDNPRFIEMHQKLMQQVAQAIYSITRAEDLLTYLGDGRFVITTPNSSGLSIATLIARVEAVVRMTEFFINDKNCTIDTECHYFDNLDSCTAPEIMERLFA